MSDFLRILLILLLVLGNALFVAGEYALVSGRRSRLQERAEAGSRGARAALQLMDEPVVFISTVQVGITVFGIAMGAIGTPLLESYFDPIVAAGLAFAIAFVILTYLSVVLGELVPKAIALQRAETIAVWLAPPIAFLARIAKPIVWLLQVSANNVARLFGIQPSPSGVAAHTEEDIRMIVAEGRQSGGVEQVEEELIYKVFDFADKEAHDVMVPRPEVVMIAVDLPAQECLDAIVDSPYTRYPAYRDSVDEIVGILHVRDLFKALYDRGIDNVQIEELLRPPYFVPETKDLAALLAEFRRTNQHMAIVVDEYGAMEGIVTLEDLLEEIVGEIEDEYDLPDESLTQIDDHTVRVDGTFPIDDFNERFKTELPQEDYHTLAGFVFGALGRAPEQDDEVQWNGLRFRVVEVDGARIEQLDIEFPSAGAASRRRGRSVVEPVGFAGEAAPSQWPRPRGAPRPELLDLGVETLPRVGPSLAKKLGRLGLRTIRDLLEHRPHRYEEPVPERPIADVLAEEEVAIAGEVLSVNVRRPRRRLALVEARVSDGTGAVKATWFNQAWLAEKLQPGTRVRLRGSLGRYGFTVKSYDLDGGGATADFAPVYPATEDLTPKRIRELVAAALDLAGEQWDPLPAALRVGERLPTRSDALRALHQPSSLAEAEAGRRRLAFDELLVFQLGLARRRGGRETQSAAALPEPGELAARYRTLLPFTLTEGQERAIAEIDADLARPKPMERLLQGDVGSGKTVVALYALLRAAESGFRGALMAPTETLAEQHFLTIEPLCRELGASVGLLTSSVPARERATALEAGILVGTHALIQEDVDLSDVAVAVVDEQHRFGVEQRRAITGGRSPHVLHMTATPIPRTLALTVTATWP